MRSNFACYTATHLSRSVGESAGPPVSPPGQKQCPSEYISVGTHFARISVVGYEPGKAPVNRLYSSDTFLAGTEERLSPCHQGGKTQWDAIAMAMGRAGIPAWLHGMTIWSMQARPQHDRLEVLDLCMMAVLLSLHGAR